MHKTLAKVRFLVDHCTIRIMATYLGGVRALILEKGMGKGRACILQKQLEAHGGSVVSSLEPSVTTCTHLLVGKNVRRSLAKKVSVPLYSPLPPTLFTISMCVVSLWAVVGGGWVRYIYDGPGV